MKTIAAVKPNQVEIIGVAKPKPGPYQALVKNKARQSAMPLTANSSKDIFPASINKCLLTY